MARAKSQGNGRADRLEDALSHMLQGQALLQQQLAALAVRQADTDSRIAEYERRIDERFKHIETILLEPAVNGNPKPRPANESDNWLRYESYPFNLPGKHFRRCG